MKAMLRAEQTPAIARNASVEGQSRRARGDALVAFGLQAAEGVALFTIAGVYASTLGLGITTATILSSVFAACVFIGRRLLKSRDASLTPETRDTPIGYGVLASMLLLSIPVAVLLPNDVNNTDPARQLAMVEQATYYHTLLTPGFYSDRGTKYDGWTFLHAATASATGIRPLTLVRYSKLLLLPCFVVALYVLVRLLGLGGAHLSVAVALTLLFSGDSFRLISLGGARSWGYAFQILGLVSLLASATGTGRPSRAAVVGGAVFLAASSIVHLFFAFANALIVAIVCALGVVSRDRRRWLPAALVLAGVFAVTTIPYGYLKSGQALSAGRQNTPTRPEWLPDLPRRAPVVAAEGSHEEVPELFSLRWGEYGSLIPFFMAPLCWLGGTRPRKATLLYVALFAMPCAFLIVPPLRHALIGVIDATRVFRILPLSPAVAAIAVYASAVHAASRGRGRAGRAAGAFVLIASVAVLVPSAQSTWAWYANVYASTVPAGTSDRPYIGIGSLLALGTERWPAVVASSEAVALKIAAVTNRPVAFYLHGERRWATRIDISVDPNQDRPIPWEFVVLRVSDPEPREASCAETLYTDEGITLCVTRRGLGSWSYPGTGQRWSIPIRKGANEPDA